MKKLLILLPIIALTACDRPKHTLELTCELDLEWQNNFPIRLNTKPSGEYDITFTNVKINLQLFDNYAKLTLDDITTTLEKVKEKSEFLDILLHQQTDISVHLTIEKAIKISINLYGNQFP